VDKRNLDKNTLANKILTLLLQIIPHYFSKTLFGYVKDEAGLVMDSLHNEAFKLAQSYISTVVAQQGQKLNDNSQIMARDTLLIELTLTVIQKVIILHPS
jgi:hypothetical protein